MNYTAESKEAQSMLSSELEKMLQLLQHADRSTHRQLTQALSIIRAERYRLAEKADPERNSTARLEAEFSL